jgi:hypothetical protein
MKKVLAIIYVAILVVACHPPPPELSGPNQELIARGKDIFFNQTFDGNG